MTASERYDRWCKTVTDPDLSAQLAAMKNDPDAIAEAFHADLAFGTAGLRGILGAGSFRMNVYTVGRATQGFADYLNAHYDAPTVAVSFDSRIQSDRFSRRVAEIFAANGIRVGIFAELQPTPTLSFTVRRLHCSGGVMITASHNPAEYNGYKAYGNDGCQLSVTDSEAVTAAIEQVDLFTGVRVLDFDEGVKQGLITLLGDELPLAFQDAVFANAIHPELCRTSGLRVAYTPLNGTGRKPVCRLLDRLGLTYDLVASQAEPDGHFPTCPYPNPEIKEALQKGLELCEEKQPDLLLATDPDSDRVGTAVRLPDGSYRLITGNEMGCLLFDYLFSQLIAVGRMPENPVAVKTIVTTFMADEIGAHYGVDVRNVYTGFKYISSVATELERQGHPERFLAGFEESYGYTVGSHVRDKDAVVATLFICEMAAFYKAAGSSLPGRLDELYAQYGCHTASQQSFTYEGIAGAETIRRIMVGLRRGLPPVIGGHQLAAVADYLTDTETPVDGAPPRTLHMCEPSDVLGCRFTDGTQVIVRPSGTEPKLKLYYLIKKPTFADAKAAEDALRKDFTEIIASLAANA